MNSASQAQPGKKKRLHLIQLNQETENGMNNLPHYQEKQIKPSLDSDANWKLNALIPSQLQ